jgi:hypothetical protein
LTRSTCCAGTGATICSPTGTSFPPRLGQEPVNEQNVQMEADQVVDPPPPKQMRTTSVQASNCEDIIDNYLNTVNPILMPCSNETDILVSEEIKEKIWNFEYTDSYINIVN